MPEEQVFALSIEASGEVTPAAEQPQTADDDTTEPEEAEQ